MDLYRKKEECCGCGACAEQCPKGAINIIQDKEGFYYPRIDKFICIECGQCGLVCPIKTTARRSYDNLYIGAQARNKEIRYSSSSGGIFSILAQYVLSRKGIVYGACFDGSMRVIHRGVEDEYQLDQIKRTKYVQSDMQGIYDSIKKQLTNDRWVLFCGTPCQAQALMLFLNRIYERLIVVDLVCYGVPSPGIWETYVRYLEFKHRGKLTDFSFRDKRNRDNGQMRSYKINGKEYVSFLYEDIYCRMYFKNYIIRPSCYSCKFCTVNRDSDFTIGDFWGIQRYKPAFDDGMGTSLVIAHSEQAKKIWDEVKEEVFWFTCRREDLLQPRLINPTGFVKGRWGLMLLYKMLVFGLSVK